MVGCFALLHQLGSLENPAPSLSQNQLSKDFWKKAQPSACFQALQALPMRNSRSGSPLLGGRVLLALGLDIRAHETTPRGLSLVQPGLPFSPSLAEGQGGFSQELKGHVI